VSGEGTRTGVGLGLGDGGELGTTGLGLAAADGDGSFDGEDETRFELDGTGVVGEQPTSRTATAIASPTCRPRRCRPITRRRIAEVEVQGAGEHRCAAESGPNEGKAG